MKYSHIVLFSIIAMTGQVKADFYASDGDFAPGTWTTEFFTIGPLLETDFANAVTDRFIGGEGPFMLHQYSVNIAADNFYRLEAPVFLNSFVYDPGAEGAAVSISASIKTLNVAPPPNVDYGVTWVRLYLIQDGEYYATSLLTNLPLELGDPDKIHTVTGLTEDDFTHVIPNGFIDFNTHPDFGGSAMQFGFVQAIEYSSTESLGSFTLAAGFDDVSVRISSVPEPATMGLLGFGAIAAVLRRRR